MKVIIELEDLKETPNGKSKCYATITYELKDRKKVTEAQKLSEKIVDLIHEEGINL